MQSGLGFVNITLHSPEANIAKWQTFKGTFKSLKIAKDVII